MLCSAMITRLSSSMVHYATQYVILTRGNATVASTFAQPRDLHLRGVTGRLAVSSGAVAVFLLLTFWDGGKYLFKLLY